MVSGDRVMADGVFFAQIFEQRRQRREPMPDRGTLGSSFVGGGANFSALEIVAPGDDMRAGHRAEFFRAGDAGEANEITDRVFVGALGAGIGVTTRAVRSCTTQKNA